MWLKATVIMCVLYGYGYVRTPTTRTYIHIFKSFHTEKYTTLYVVAVVVVDLYIFHVY